MWDIVHSHWWVHVIFCVVKFPSASLSQIASTAAHVQRQCNVKLKSFKRFSHTTDTLVCRSRVTTWHSNVRCLRHIKTSHNAQCTVLESQSSPGAIFSPASYAKKTAFSCMKYSLTFLFTNSRRAENYGEYELARMTGAEKTAKKRSCINIKIMRETHWNRESWRT